MSVAVTPVVVAMLLVGTSLAARVEAQSAREVAAARHLYQVGVRHAEAGRWEEARVAFAQSLEIVERPATLLNYAGACVQTGHLVEGAETYRRYLRVADNEARRTQARTLLDELEARLARVEIATEGLEPDDDLMIDGERVSHALVGAETPFDPGHHEIELRRNDARVAHQELDLTEGQHESVTLHVLSTASADGSVALAADATEGEADVLDTDPDGQEAPESTGGGGILSSPWFWVITAAILVAGGVTVGVVVATSDSGAPAYRGNVGSGRLGVP